METYILTAELDPDSFAWLDALRSDHFPLERNLLPAHLTLFHRLSAAQTARLDDLPIPAAAVPISCVGAVLLGFGVAIRVRSPTLDGIRSAAQKAMGDEFSRQDSHTWRAHVTIQNKVTADMAKRLHRDLERDFVQRAGVVTGLLVWSYLGGPWRLVRKIPFG
jgi:hypothetical protein